MTSLSDPGVRSSCAAVLPDALVPFVAHLLRHDDDGRVALELRDVCHADAEVARGGADDGVLAGLDFAGQFAFHQRGVGRTDLVAARREIPPDEDHDIGLDARQFLGKHDVADAVVGPAPRDVEQVGGVELMGVAASAAARTAGGSNSGCSIS